MDNDELKHKKALNRLRVMKTEEKEKLKFRNYLEEFDEYFKTNTKEQMEITPLLLCTFREFIQITYGPSGLYMLALKSQNKIAEDLMKNFSEEQKHLFTLWKNCQKKMVDDMVEQAFIYRICDVLSIRL